MRVLVTGSSGLVGARLVSALERLGVEVVRFDLRDGDGQSDIRDRAAVGLAAGGCDGIFHLAAVSRVAWGEMAPGLCHDINVTGTANVIAAAQEAPKKPWVVFASSREVYGALKTVPATESTPFGAINQYGRSKIEGERLLGAAKGLRSAVLRLSNVYGAVNDHPDRAVPALLSRAMRSEDMTISGAETYFDFVHVDDCVRGLLTSMWRLVAGGRVAAVQLVSGVATSLLDLATLARDVAGTTSQIHVVPARSFDVPGFVGDPARARRLIDWTAEISLRQGLERLLTDLTALGGPMAPVEMPPDREGRDGMDGAAGAPERLHSLGH